MTYHETTDVEERFEKFRCYKPYLSGRQLTLVESAERIVGGKA